MLDPAVSSGQRARLQVDELAVALSGAGDDVVGDISFSVAAGEITGLVGESGSGKTTVALALLGHARRGLTVRGGAVLVDGVDMLSLSRDELRRARGSRVAYVPQDPSAALNPTLRIKTQLREALKAHPGHIGDVDARVSEVLDEVRLDSSRELLGRYPHELSGGQQQRVALAMAFACRPSLIVLDEPTTGLDVTTQRHVLETVKQLCAGYGAAAVYVSHDLAVVGDLANQVAVMYAGRIVELGSSSSVLSAPVHPYSRRLVEAIPSPEEAHVLIGLDGSTPRPGRRPPGCSFAPRCRYRQDRCQAQVPAAVPVGSRLVRCVRTAELTGQPPVVRTPPPTTTDPRRPRLTVSDLGASYGPRQILFDIDLVVPDRACVAVVGESGSGKTTLARSIAGLHSNWSGDVQLDEQHLARRASDRDLTTLRRLQYIFQNPYTSLNPRKTIGQTIGQTLEHFFGSVGGEQERRIAEALSEVSLGADAAERYPDELSGGERQRVAIARALIASPEVLICDEVTSALDVSVQAVIVELLRRLQHERGLSLVFITHNLALVRSIAQDVVVLQGGRIVESGPTDEILGNPREPYTIRLIEDVPTLGAIGADEPRD